MIRWFLLICALTGIPSSGLAGYISPFGEAHKPNLLQLARSLNLTKFVEAIEKFGIDRIINHEGKFTVFAPNDAAFSNEKIYPDETTLKDKMRFHVARGDVTINDFKRILLSEYTNAEAVVAWGGEDNDPPIYGKVYLALKPKSGFQISTAAKNDIIDNILYNIVLD